MDHLVKCIPEEAGIPSSALLKLMQRLSKVEYINSIMILRHGKLCCEAFAAPYERNVPHQLFSLSKSFTSCAIGIAQSEKLLNINDKLLDFFPEYQSVVTDERMFKVTLRDLLTMRSGHLTCPSRFFWESKDWRQTYLASSLDCEPGTTFTYNSGASFMLAAVIKKVTGCNLREYLMPRLFEPLNIAPGIWEKSPEGIDCGGWGLYLKTADIAKFAQMLLQNGVWQGKVIVPQEYLAEATRKQSDNSMNIPPDWKVGYGYQFWLSRHGYRGDGASGQYALMLPEEDMAIAVTSCIGNMQDILTAIWEELLPELSDKALPGNQAVYEELQKFNAALALPTTPGDTSRRGKNHRFEFADNAANIKSCEVAFGSDDCTLTFEGPHGIEQLRAGFGYFAKSNLQLTDLMAHPVAASAAWIDENTLEIRTFITDGIYRDIWTIDFSDTVQPLKNKGLCGCFRPLKPALILQSK